MQLRYYAAHITFQQLPIELPVKGYVWFNLAFFRGLDEDGAAPDRVSLRRHLDLRPRDSFWSYIHFPQTSAGVKLRGSSLIRNTSIQRRVVPRRADPRLHR